MTQAKSIKFASRMANRRATKVSYAQTIQRQIEKITGLTSRTASEWHSERGAHWSTEHQASYRFTESLDDMAHAEQWLRDQPRDEWDGYLKYRNYLMRRGLNGVFASALERAEAFVKILSE